MGYLYSLCRLLKIWSLHHYDDDGYYCYDCYDYYDDDSDDDDV